MPAIEIPQSARDIWSNLRETMMGSPTGALGALTEMVYPSKIEDAFVGGIAGLGAGYLGTDPKMAWKNFFNLEDAGAPMYTNILNNAGYFANKKNISASVEAMSPWDYMRRIAEQRVPPSTAEREFSAVDQSLVKAYTERARAGEKMPMPVIEKYPWENQEGRHRAMVARALGLKEMPVLVIDELKNALRGIK